MSHDINAREYDAWKLAEPEPKPCERCGGTGELDCPNCVWWTKPFPGAAAPVASLSGIACTGEDDCEICHGRGAFKCPDCAE